MLGRLFARPFREPTGSLGRLVGNFIARGNEYEGEWTFTLLNIQAGDHVLEIGFGPGDVIQRAVQKVLNGLVAGTAADETSDLAWHPIVC